MDPLKDLARTPPELANLGVLSIAPTELEGPPKAFLIAEGVSYSGTGGNLNGYVERFLARTQDVTLKLALAAGAGSAHVFIWVSLSSPYAAWVSLRDEDVELPVSSLQLPPGVTHIWLATQWVGRSVIHYSPDVGWRRTSRVFTNADDAAIQEGTQA